MYPRRLKLNQVVSYAKDWRRLPPDSRFSKLQKAYWGRSLDLAAGQWRMSHKELFTEAAGSETEAEVFEGDDVIAGCHVIEIPDLEVRPFLVRAEYIRLYDAIMAHYRQAVNERKTTGAVVTGQPGIGMDFFSKLTVLTCFAGKSVGRTYFLRRLLGDEMPVLWQSPEALYLIAADGAFIAPQTGDIDLRHFIIALVEADPLLAVPPRLVAKEAYTFPILSTSPEKKRWNRWHKTRFQAPLVLVMNPWKRQELHRA